MNAKETNKKNEVKPTAVEGDGATIPVGDVCQKAPEWAEHSRLRDDDMPCDDGRAGDIKNNTPKK